MNHDSDPGAGRPNEGAPDPAGMEKGPIGTLFVLLLYLMALVGIWATLYWILLSR